MKWELMEHYLKLILRGFCLLEGEVFVSEAFLLFLGMPNTIRSLVSKGKQTNEGKWVSKDIGGRLYILLNSIPDRTRAKLNLNISQDYLKDLLVAHQGIFDETILTQVKSESYLILQKEIANHEKYLPTFYDLCTTKEERITQAINLAILRVIVSFIKKYPRGLIDHFYDVLKDEKIAKHSIPVQSKNYFYKYVRRIVRTGLPAGLINGNRDKASNNLKLTNTLKQLIIYLKAYGNFTSCREIADNIRKLRANPAIENEIKQVSESTIRNFLAQPEADNLTLLARQGYRKFEEQIIGYLPLNRTKDPLTKIIIDGYNIQVICEGDDGKPLRLVLFSIMDSYSGVVMLEVGDVEDYHLMRKAFEKFLRFTQMKMPREIVSDRHASIQSKYFKPFRDYLTDNGVNWIESSNPRRKAQLERWFGTLQQIYLTKVIGYIGEGIKSRRKDAHPSEEVQLIIRSKEYLKNKDELCRLIHSATDDYNRNAHFKNAASPLDLYHLKKPVYYVQLQDFHIPYFFWDRHEVKLHGSMIIIKATVDGHAKKWFYRRDDFDFTLLNQSELDVYHCPSSIEMVYLFKRGTNAFIATAKLQVAANEALADQTEQDKKIIAEFGLSKAKLRESYINRLEEIETNLKNTLGIEPGELRAKAEFKKEADNYVGYNLGIADKTPDADLSKPYKLFKGRKPLKKSKGRRKSQVLKKLGIHDTMG